MAEKPKVSTIERGTRFAHLLKTATINRFDSSIITAPSILKQIPDGPWDKFVTFPSPKDFPISNTSMRPESLLLNLGMMEEQARMSEEALVGEGLSKFQKPTFLYSHGGFTLRVINGMFNEHSLKMTEMASHGFDFDSYMDRAEYQNAMQKLATTIVRSNYNTDSFGLRIFDDCIASADSIYGYLFSQLHSEGGEERIRRGVRLDAITATPQAILFLRRFAQVMGFPLEINVAQLAPGLTEKNYIVYPDEFLESGILPEELVKRLQGYRNYEDGSIYVVGDMGNAQRGLSDKEMQAVRSQKQDILYLRFNDQRTDSHGDHPKKSAKVNTIMIEQEEIDELPTVDFVYFARGGYLPLQLDMTYGNGALKQANIIVLRGSRKEVNGQYGVAFGPEKE